MCRRYAHNNNGNISNGDGVGDVGTGASAAGVSGEFVDYGADGLGNNEDAAGARGLLENDEHLIHEQSPYRKSPEIPDKESTDWEPKHHQQLIE